MSKCLFISWDGPQTSYIEGLFLPIFSRLSDHGHKFHILQFTWAEREAVANLKASSEAAGIPFRSAPVWRRAGGIGPLVSSVFGRRHIQRAVRDWDIDTLVPRSLMPALAVLAMNSRHRCRLIFDADGFPADESVDFRGLSTDSATYRILKMIETHTARVADRVLVRTPRSIDILMNLSSTERSKFFVVGNGKDPNPFSSLHSRTDNEFRLCYAGSLGSQYRPEQMMDVAKQLRAKIPNFVFRIFTGDSANLEVALSRSGISDRSWIETSRLPPSEIPNALMQCDLALALRQPAFSTQGIMPIKIGEYLLAGLPVIGTPGVGAVEPLIEKGVMLPVREDISGVWPWVRDSVVPKREIVRKKARALGLKHFSLDATVDSYLAALSVPA